MPELPEVETVATELNRKIAGKTVIRLISMSNKLSQKDADRIRGCKVVSVFRRAKLIRIRFTKGLSVLAHLKMTGRLFFVPKGGEAIETPYVRAVFGFRDGSSVFFEDVRRFGYIKVLGDKEADKIIDSYGIEPLTREFTVSAMSEILKRYKNSRIKPLLLDQTKIAGIGNIYADEILFKARIHPLSRAGGLVPHASKLHHAIKFVLNKAVRLKGASIESYLRTGGERGEYDRVRYVYQRAGRSCPNRCGGEIKRISVGGRGTYFCPRCQRI